ncbi:hypothetical protein BJV82DRAFT_408756 [Fennellomyces sp. T-0311]|nr:hypothetical protein BJV82DRAFT_408756 [Fennellomyces sp. T-0311]
MGEFRYGIDRRSVSWLRRISSLLSSIGKITINSKYPPNTLLGGQNHNWAGCPPERAVNIVGTNRAFPKLSNEPKHKVLQVIQSGVWLKMIFQHRKSVSIHHKEIDNTIITDKRSAYNGVICMNKKTLKSVWSKWFHKCLRIHLSLIPLPNPLNLLCFESENLLA